MELKSNVQDHMGLYDLIVWSLMGMLGTVRHSFVCYGAIWIDVERKRYAGLYNLKKCE